MLNYNVNGRGWEKLKSITLLKYILYMIVNELVKIIPNILKNKKIFKKLLILPNVGYIISS